VLRTFSKAWGLAGLRVGYGVAGDAATMGTRPPAAWISGICIE